MSREDANIMGLCQLIASPDASCLAGEDIRVLVANEEGSRHVYGKLVLGSYKQPGCRFTALTNSCIRAYRSVRVVRAVVDGRQRRAKVPELLKHPIGQASKVVFRVIAFSDSGLIGDNDKDISVLVESPTCLESSRQEPELFDPMYVSDVRINDAIPV